jgi:alcohol dehydrogenase
MCDGGLTEQVLLPAAKLHPVGLLTYSQAALVETLAIGCHAVDRGSPKPDENALILGAGPIGLSAIEFAKLSGAHVIVADVNAQRLEFVAHSMGVKTVVQLKGDDQDIDAIIRLGNGRLADVVIDATGNHRSMVRAFEFAAFAGRVVYVGITQNDIQFPHAPVFHRRELTLIASRNAMPGDFRRIIRLIEEEKINTDPWMTHRASFDEVPHVFDGWLSPESGVIKAIIEVT